jgi:hypothetical protein
MEISEPRWDRATLISSQSAMGITEKKRQRMKSDIYRVGEVIARTSTKIDRVQDILMYHSAYDAPPAFTRQCSAFLGSPFSARFLQKVNRLQLQVLELVKV